MYNPRRQAQIFFCGGQIIIQRAAQHCGITGEVERVARLERVGGVRPVLRIGFFQHRRQFFLHFFGGLAVDRVAHVVQRAAFAPFVLLAALAAQIGCVEVDVLENMAVDAA